MVWKNQKNSLGVIWKAVCGISLICRPQFALPLLNLLLGTRDAQRLLSFCSLFLATAIKRRSLNEQSSILW